MLFETLREMAAEGRTVIFISHKLHEVKAVADRVTVLRGGRSLATVSTADATPRSLAALMVGRELGERRRDPRARAGRARARARGRLGARRPGRASRRAVRRSSCVRARSSPSPASPATASASSPRRSRACARRPTGTVRIGGEAVARRRPARGDRGRCRLRPRGPARHRRRAEPQHRVEPRAQVLPRAVRVARAAAARSGRIREHAVELIRRYRIAAPGPAAPARLLSGGNLQKVVLAREFSGQPAARPRRVADAGARRRRDRDRARVPARCGGGGRRACSCSARTSTRSSLLADRIAVMYEGAIVGETTRAERERRGARPADGGRSGSACGLSAGFASRAGCWSPSRRARSSLRSSRPESSCSPRGTTRSRATG